MKAAANIAYPKLACTLAVIATFAMSCSSRIKIDRFELVELERKGYSITLDSIPVKLAFTHLDDANISEIRADKRRKSVNIFRKDSKRIFYTVADLMSQKNYSGTIDMIAVDGLVLDSVMIQKSRFEEGSVRYIRLLSQKDYDTEEFDDLPQVKQTIGNGILIINTR